MDSFLVRFDFGRYEFQHSLIPPQQRLAVLTKEQYEKLFQGLTLRRHGHANCLTCGLQGRHGLWCMLSYGSICICYPACIYFGPAVKQNHRLQFDEINSHIAQRLANMGAVFTFKADRAWSINSFSAEFHVESIRQNQSQPDSVLSKKKLALSTSPSV